MTNNYIHEMEEDLPFWPFWLCLECGMEYSKNNPSPKCVWNEGQCDICKKIRTVAQLRYYLKKE